MSLSSLVGLEVLEDEKMLVMHLMLHLVSKKHAGGLYYHKHPDLCNLMETYHVPYHVQGQKIWYVAELIPFEVLFSRPSTMIYTFIKWIVAERHIESLPPSKWQRVKAFMREMEATESV